MAIEGIFSSGLSAYQKAQNLKGEGGVANVSDVKAGGSFGDFLADYTHDAVDTLQKGEQATVMAAQGKADITEVVTALSKAEITLELVVAARDKVINAYQEIVRMPI